MKGFLLVPSKQPYNQTREGEGRLSGGNVRTSSPLNTAGCRLFSTGFTPASESQIFFLVGELTLFCASLFIFHPQALSFAAVANSRPFDIRGGVFFGSDQSVQKGGDCGGGNQVTSHFSIGRQNNFQPRSRIIPAMPNCETVLA